MAGKRLKGKAADHNRSIVRIAQLTRSGLVSKSVVLQEDGSHQIAGQASSSDSEGDPEEDQKAKEARKKERERRKERRRLKEMDAAGRRLAY